MGNLYEGMFLLDNQVVRADWGRAKAAVTELLAKHGARVHTARRWDERKLTYKIKGHTRATYLLAYFDAGPGGVNEMRRDLELEERILRYLIIGAAEVPADEVTKTQEEAVDGYAVPVPPQDEQVTAERRMFGDLADRPIYEPRRHGDAPEEEAAPGEEAPEGAAVATEEIN